MNWTSPSVKMPVEGEEVLIKTYKGIISGYWVPPPPSPDPDDMEDTKPLWRGGYWYCYDEFEICWDDAIWWCPYPELPLETYEDLPF